MQRPSVAKECDIFTRARTAGSRSVKTTSPPNANTTVANNMANVADVLRELKALRSEFGSKLDRINNRLGELTTSISVLEDNLGEIKREVTANERHVEEAEARIATMEEMLDKTETALQRGSHTWRKRQRIWRTVGDGKISDCSVSKREPQVTVLFWTSYMTCYPSGWRLDPPYASPSNSQPQQSRPHPFSQLPRQRVCPTLHETMGHHTRRIKTRIRPGSLSRNDAPETGVQRS